MLCTSRNVILSNLITVFFFFLVMFLCDFLINCARILFFFRSKAIKIARNCFPSVKCQPKCSPATTNQIDRKANFHFFFIIISCPAFFRTFNKYFNYHSNKSTHSRATQQTTAVLVTKEGNKKRVFPYCLFL